MTTDAWKQAIIHNVLSLQKSSSMICYCSFLRLLYKCTRKIKSASVPVIRDLVAQKKLKLQAIARMHRDIEKIDEQLAKLLSG